MKKILLGTTIFAGLMAAGAAQAADMPLKAQRGPIYSDWTGFYIGIHGGYGWSDVDVNDDLRPFSEPNPKGWIFGGQAGYLRQWGTVVGGLEIDYSAAGLKETQTIKTETLTGKIDSLFSARARLGWLWTPNLLAYGTAGLGWGHSKVSFCDPGCDTSTDSSFGWVAGAGLEYQFNYNWRLRAEYLHYDFGTVTHLGVDANVKVDVVRGALSYKF